MRAILLATATATTFHGFFAKRLRIQAARGVAFVRADRITAVAPTTRSVRRYPSPIRVISPIRSLPPELCVIGVKPSHAANSRPEENSDMSGTEDVSALAV